jgi:hypothetical protein
MRRIYVTTAFLSLLLLSSFSVLAQTQSREDLLKQIQTKRNEIEARRADIAKLQKGILLPSAEDQKRYEEFLKEPDTGLIRLLPREKYDETNPEAPSGIPLRGGGAYYSFSSRSQEYGQGSDLSLQQNELSVGFAGADYGLLTSLGDVPLDQITLQTSTVKILAAYTPPTEERLARLEYRKISQGTELDGATFKNRLPLRADTTFLLRSVNYSYSSGSGGSDVLVAFRVVRIDCDGSAVILWKMLKQYPAPQFVRAAN